MPCPSDCEARGAKFKRGTMMLQPATGWIRCNACNASYESELRLREHQKTFHRGSDATEKAKTATVPVRPEIAKP